MKPAGTFTTEWLLAHIGSLLEHADSELRAAVEEYIRLSQNTINAYQSQSDLIQYVGRCSDGSWVKNGKKYPTYEAMKKADG